MRGNCVYLLIFVESDMKLIIESSNTSNPLNDIYSARRYYIKNILK